VRALIGACVALVSVAVAAQELPAVRVQNISVYANDVRFSAAAKERYAGQRVSGRYRLHLDAEGRVTNVDAVEPIDDADEGVRLTLRRYKFRPPGQATVTFIMPVELNFIAAAPTGYRALPPTALDGQKLSGATPRLPATVHASGKKPLIGAYLLYIERDGSVSRVEVQRAIAGADDAIVATLLGWKFRPQPERVRVIRSFTFAADQ
jgi:hypothetical protein